MNGIDIRSLSWSYGDKRALDDVSLSVAPGRFCALLGPNGAGKTTLFALATGLLRAHDGRISINGVDLGAAPRAALARLGIVFQQPTLDLDLTVAHNLRYFGALHGLSARETARRADAALDLLELTDRRGERARRLNGGHRRRVEIARSLIHAPRVLLLDEPTVGLDVAVRRDITTYAHRLAVELDIAVLWATHLVDEARETDDLVVLHRGRVRAAGVARDIVREQGASDLAQAFLKMTRDAAQEAA